MKDKQINQVLVWVATWSLVIAAILFGTGVIYINAVYCGIAPAVISLVCAVVYCLRRHGKPKCACQGCCCACLESQCNTCLERTCNLCLHVPGTATVAPPENDIGRTSAFQQHRDSHNLNASPEQRDSAVVAEGRNCSSQTNSSYHHTTDAVKRGLLRQMEADINGLFQLHSELENMIASAEVITIPLDRLAYDAHVLQNESEKVQNWIETQSAVLSMETLEVVNNRLRRIRRHFNLFKLQITGRSSRGSPSQSVFLTRDNTARYINRSDSVTSHTAYSSQDRRWSHTRMSDCSMPSLSVLSEHLDYAGYSSHLPPYQEIDPLELDSLQIPPPGGALLSIDNQLANHGLLSMSTCSLAPPPVDFHAPPSYEEATTSQV